MAILEPKVRQVIEGTFVADDLDDLGLREYKDLVERFERYQNESSQLMNWWEELLETAAPAKNSKDQ